jgi:hypothetical protein
MVIIICSDCKKEMSDAAPACPSCGKPNLQIPSRSVGLLLAVGIVFLPIIFSWLTLRKGYSTKSRVIALSWAAVILLVMIAGNKPLATLPAVAPVASSSPMVESTKQVVEPPKKEEPMLVVSSAELAAAYNDNTIAADQKYKGKKYKVSGTVAAINTDFLGNPYLTLKGGVNQFMEPQFKFEKSETAQLATLKKGAKVTMVCIGNGDVVKTPMSESCTLQ